MNFPFLSKNKSNKFLLINYEAVIFYGITLIFAVAVCFVFFNIINNPDLADQAIARSGGTWSDVQMPFSSMYDQIPGSPRGSLLSVLWSDPD